MAFLAALALGFITGLRSMLGPAFVSWAAWLGIIHVQQTPLAFMGFHYTHLIFTVLAIGELIGDKLPFTPSRKAAGPFGARLVSGALVGATVGASVQSLAFCIILGVAGAVVGTLGGAAARSWLAARFGRDLPAALLEDAMAIALGCLCLVVCSSWRL
jgi:uncharacterized membrane protein